MLTAIEARAMLGTPGNLDPHAYVMRMIEIAVIQAAPHKTKTHICIPNNAKQSLDAVVAALHALGYKTEQGAGVLFISWE